MKIEKIRTDQFPRGRGSTIKTKQEFLDLLQTIQKLDSGECLRVTSVKDSKTSAETLRNLVIAELKRKRREKEFDVTTGTNGTGQRDLYVKRFGGL